VRAVLAATAVESDALISLLFRCRPHLLADFRAAAARETGLGDGPLMCATEIAVPGALPRVVRLMAHAELDVERSAVQHVYLHGATTLRKDLAQCARGARRRTWAR